MKNLEKYLIENNKIVKINSKEILVGDVFVALKGNKVHGNKFIDDALKKGAKYVITDFIEDYKNLNSQVIIVKNTLSFLLTIAKKKRKLFNGEVIGITGSVGKTSLKDNLNYLLTSNFNVSASIKSYNNYLGVILSLINIDVYSNFAIFELGTNNFDEIKILTAIVKPSQAIITNISPTHLENFLNTKNIAIEKSDIFNKKYNANLNFVILPNNNVDEKILFNIAKAKNIKNIIRFGENQDSDLKIIKINKINENISEIFLNYKNQNFNIFINNNQFFRLNNILICFLIFILNNISLNIFHKFSKTIPLVQGRGMQSQIFINNKKITLIDESYNASPVSMMQSINYLSNIKLITNQKKFLILGEMKELGENKLKFHIELLKYINEKKLENVIICGKLFELALHKTINSKIRHMRDIKLILKYLDEHLHSNDILFIKGSNTSLTNKLTEILLRKKGN